MRKILQKFLDDNKKDIEYLSKNYQKVIDTCAEINKSWSKTFAGSNGLLYYKNFEEPDMYNRFNEEWGCVEGVPEGWRKPSEEEFIDILKKSISKDFDIKKFEKTSQSLFNKAIELKESLITESLRKKIQETDLLKIEKFQIGRSSSDFILDIIPTQIQSRDFQALAEGTPKPIHIGYKSSAQSARSVIDGLKKLDKELERIDIISDQNTPILNNDIFDNLNKDISKKTKKLYENGHHDQAVEAGFKIVRDRLRALTTFETGAEAFGKGKLVIDGCSASNTEKDFNEGVKFLTMAIDQFRNDKAHTSNNILDPKLAFKYLILSSLAMDLLENARLKP